MAGLWTVGEDWNEDSEPWETSAPVEEVEEEPIEAWEEDNDLELIGN